MNRLLEIVAESLEVDATDVRANLLFREHTDWNSLAALSLITAIEDEFGVVLGDSDLRAVQTAGELWELVEKRASRA